MIQLTAGAIVYRALGQLSVTVGSMSASLAAGWLLGATEELLRAVPSVALPYHGQVGVSNQFVNA